MKGHCTIRRGAWKEEVEGKVVGMAVCRSHVRMTFYIERVRL